jgi:hypothetical protein
MAKAGPTYDKSQVNTAAVNNQVRTRQYPADKAFDYAAANGIRTNQYTPDQVLPNQVGPAQIPPATDASIPGTGGGQRGSVGDWIGGVVSNLPIPSGPARHYPTEPVYSAPATYAQPASVTVPQTAAASSGIVDLVLEDVKLVADATLVAGPAYAVRFRNQGTQACGKFVVAVLASLDGQVGQHAPRAVMEVPALGAGEMGELVLRLPGAAMKMGAEQSPFRYVVLVVDGTNSVAELDEQNNGAVVERSALSAE